MFNGNESLIFLVNTTFFFINLINTGKKRVLFPLGFSYVVGAMCAVCGMMFTGLPIPIIASNFNLYYTYAKTKMLMVENTLREIRNKKKKGNF